MYYLKSNTWITFLAFFIIIIDNIEVLICFFFFFFANHEALLT